MIISRFYLIVMVLTLLCLSAPVTHAQTSDAPLFEDLIVFGDSLSDPGNLPIILNGADIPGPPYFDNQFSNGPVYPKLLPGLLGFSTTDDLNFAVGGAKSGPGVTRSGFGIDHVNSFLNGNGSGAQIAGFLSTGRTISPKDLFILNIGGNDYLSFDSDVDDDMAVVSNTVSNVTTQTLQLIDAGAKQIVVPLVSDIGLTPSTIARGADAVTAGTAITDAHNSALAASLADITTANDVQIYVVDSPALLRDTVANPSKYGLTNVTETCLQGGVVCNNPDAYLFFDGVHPTAAAHEVIAKVFADNIISTRMPGAQTELAARTATAFDRLLTDYVKQDVDDSQWTGFATVSYLDGERDTESFALGYDYTGYTATIGTVRALENLKFGGALSYAKHEGDYALDKGQFDTTSWRAGIFAQAENKIVSGTLGASYSLDDHDIQRNTGVAQQLAQAQPDGNSFTVSAEVRLKALHEMMDLEAFEVTPLARLRYVESKVDGYTETGAVALDRIVNSHKVSPVTAEIGADISHLSDRIYWRLEGVWSQDLNDNGQSITSALATVPDVPITITTQGTDDSYGRASGVFGFGVTNSMAAHIGGTISIARSDGQEFSIFAGLTHAF